MEYECVWEDPTKEGYWYGDWKRDRALDTARDLLVLNVKALVQQTAIAITAAYPGKKSKTALEIKIELCQMLADALSQTVQSKSRPETELALRPVR